MRAASNTSQASTPTKQQTEPGNNPTVFTLQQFINVDIDGLRDKLFYFPRISRDQAETLLRAAGEQTFLVRKSSSEAGAWVLSAKHANNAINHSLLRVKVLQQPDAADPSKKLIEEYTIEVHGKDRTYPSIEFLADELDLDAIDLDEDETQFAVEVSVLCFAITALF